MIASLDDSRSKIDPFLLDGENGTRDHIHATTSASFVPSSSSRVRLAIPKSLPDIDDSSMSHVSAFLQHYEIDLAWSTLSNSFFLAGCTGYFVVSACAVFSARTRQVPNAEEIWVYHFFMLFSPIVYLINSVIDIKWARSLQAQSLTKKTMTDHWQDWRVMLDLEASYDCDTVEADEACSTPASAGGRHSPLKRRRAPWYVRLRRHVAHRRSVAAAFTFGVAATLAVVAVTVPYTDLESSSQISFYLSAVSVHVYVLSAVLALSGKRNRPWMDPGSSAPTLSSPERLQDLGDLFFMIGTFADVVLCDFSFDDGNPGWSLFGSLLCLLDAILYLRSDCVVAANVRRRNEEGSIVC